MSRNTIVVNLQMSIVLLTICLLTLSLTEGKKPQVKKGGRFGDPDVSLSTPQLISKYGYSVENHIVETEDGYVLTLHRIPAGIETKRQTKKGPPVIVQHGILGSSADWVLSGPNKGLAYILADAGYDVWLGNNRGNVYSTEHTSLSPKDKKFWDFSWHEMGLYDQPAMIDYILKKTGARKLFYIGHYQGNTQFYVMASELPAYNRKIHAMFALAPAAYMSKMKSPLKYIAPLVFNQKIVQEMLGFYDFRPNQKVMQLLGKVLCGRFSPTREVCSNVLFLIAGYNSEQLNKTLLPVILGHTPAGAATKQVIHYAQLIKSAKFRKYDYGPDNPEHYKDSVPPNYNLSKVTAPVALHYSDNDWLTGIDDVNQLFKELPNKIGKFRVPLKSFNHVDFMWAIDAPTLVYEKVISLMDKYRADSLRYR